MATITIKKTRSDKKDKKGRTIVIVENQYQLAPEILGEVMSYFAPAIEKHLMKIGVQKLHDMCKTCLRYRITNITSSKTGLNPEERKMILLKPLMKFHFKNDLTKKYPDIGAKRVVKKTTTDKTEFKVGDLVNYYGSHWWGDYEGGEIIKITDFKYHIQLYAKKEINKDYDTWSSIETTTYSWEDKIKTKIVRVACGFKKVNNYLFEQTHDWGR